MEESRNRSKDGSNGVSDDDDVGQGELHSPAHSINLSYNKANLDANVGQGELYSPSHAIKLPTDRIGNCMGIWSLSVWESGGVPEFAHITVSIRFDRFDSKPPPPRTKNKHPPLLFSRRLWRSIQISDRNREKLRER